MKLTASLDQMRQQVEDAIMDPKKTIVRNLALVFIFGFLLQAVFVGGGSSSSTTPTRSPSPCPRRRSSSSTMTATRGSRASSTITTRPTCGSGRTPRPTPACSPGGTTGYQINGIANRTTIADGNTWNHEHIATLGRCMVSPEKRSWNIIRHIADYVLVWAGGSGDDLGKSIHMARISTSVYDDVCPNDPTCDRFGFDHSGRPSEMMRNSMVFKLVKHGFEGVTANPRLFKEAHTSQNGLIRVFKVQNVSEESKEWISNNYECDAGGWYCPGKYPPALDKLFQVFFLIFSFLF